jgi:hypothetical protein
MSSTASTPSRKRIENENPNATAGAARPLRASSRSTSISPARTAAVSERISDSGAPSRMSLRSWANLNSVSSTRFGLRSRSGISTNSKWSRYDARASW